jgi:hypothetical protein
VGATVIGADSERVDMAMPRRLVRSSFAPLAMAACVVGVILCATPEASAQPNQPEAPQQVRPPVPGNPDKNPILVTLVGFLIVGAVLGAAVIPSKRGHQD